MPQLSTYGDYWSVLMRLREGVAVIDETLDIPLETAPRRSALATAWSVALLTAALLPRLMHLPWVHEAPAWARILALLVGLAGAVPVSYGALRLFTLVNHTMVIHLFKVRGRRLRLLNAWTTVLALVVPAAVGVSLSNLTPWAWVLTALSLLWAAWLLTHAYSVTFHCGHARAAWIWLGSTLLTLFVLCIGLISILAVAGVLLMVGLAILRAGRPGA